MSLEQPSIPPTSTQLPDTKVLQDLSTVIEKINLCTTMLHPLNSTQQVDQDESLLTIIGFLEACVPRVRELIEAGMTGALKEDTVVKCLAVNDSLCQVLEFVEHPEKCLPEKAAAAAANHDKKTNPTKDSFSFQEFDAFGITEEEGGDDEADDNFFALDTSNDSKLPAKKDDPFAAKASTAGSAIHVGDSKKKEGSTMVMNAKKPSALEDLLLTPSSSDALPPPPPPPSSSTTGNVSSGNGNGTAGKSNDPSTDNSTTNPSSKNAPGKDPIQDEFDKFFED